MAIRRLLIVIFFVLVAPGGISAQPALADVSAHFPASGSDHLPSVRQTTPQFVQTSVDDLPFFYPENWLISETKPNAVTLTNDRHDLQVDVLYARDISLGWSAVAGAVNAYLEHDQGVTEADALPIEVSGRLGLMLRKRNWPFGFVAVQQPTGVAVAIYEDMTFSHFSRYQSEFAVLASSLGQTEISVDTPIHAFSDDNISFMYPDGIYVVPYTGAVLLLNSIVSPRDGLQRDNVVMGIVDPDLMALGGGMGPQYDMDMAAQYLADNFDQGNTFEDLPGTLPARVYRNGDKGLMILLDTENGTSGIFALDSRRPPNVSELESLLTAIAPTIERAPSAAPETSELTESLTVLDTLQLNYPAGWVTHTTFGGGVRLQNAAFETSDQRPGQVFMDVLPLSLFFHSDVNTPLGVLGDTGKLPGASFIIEPESIDRPYATAAAHARVLQERRGSQYIHDYYALDFGEKSLLLDARYAAGDVEQFEATVQAIVASVRASP